MSYCALIFDIKNSRGLKERYSIQLKILNSIKLANEKFNTIIISPFMFTTGDEWEGLLTHPCDYFQIIAFFKRTIPEVDIYCGVGIGELSISDFTLTVNQLDGPVFHRAREALNYSKAENIPLTLISNSWKDI